MESVRLGEGQASACPDEQTLVPPVLSRITRFRFAIPCHQPITERSLYKRARKVYFIRHYWFVNLGESE